MRKDRDCPLVAQAAGERKLMVEPRIFWMYFGIVSTLLESLMLKAYLFNFALYVSEGEIGGALHQFPDDVYSPHLSTETSHGDIGAALRQFPDDVYSSDLSIERRIEIRGAVTKAAHRQFRQELRPRLVLIDLLSIAVVIAIVARGISNTRSEGTPS